MSRPSVLGFLSLFLSSALTLHLSGCGAEPLSDEETVGEVASAVEPWWFYRCDVSSNCDSGVDMTAEQAVWYRSWDEAPWCYKVLSIHPDTGISTYTHAPLEGGGLNPYNCDWNDAATHTDEYVDYIIGQAGEADWRARPDVGYSGWYQRHEGTNSAYDFNYVFSYKAPVETGIPGTYALTSSVYRHVYLLNPY